MPQVSLSISNGTKWHLGNRNKSLLFFWCLITERFKNYQFDQSPTNKIKGSLVYISEYNKILPCGHTAIEVIMWLLKLFNVMLMSPCD